nr:unnamed protein product [Spirometra erinaceieuropaei]
MGSPISGFIAEAVLQRLESLVFQHHRPKFWARYVDDTFVVIERDQVLTFQEHLNAVFPDIQFTMEEEESNQLAFLDVRVSTPAAVMSAMQIKISHNPDTPKDTSTIIVDTSGEDLVHTCPHCDHTFASQIGMDGHLRIHRTETDEPVPAASTYTYRIRLHCPHCPRTFMHRMVLFGHMLFHKNLR